jgi:hypothetical protein
MLRYTPRLLRSTLVPVMLIKLFVILLLLVILGSLGSALFFLVKDGPDSQRTVRALTWRIALSIGAFLVLMLGYFAGIIQPHGIYG